MPSLLVDHDQCELESATHRHRWYEGNCTSKEPFVLFLSVGCYETKSCDNPLPSQQNILPRCCHISSYKPTSLSSCIVEECLTLNRPNCFDDPVDWHYPSFLCTYSVRKIKSLKKIQEEVFVYPFQPWRRHLTTQHIMPEEQNENF